MTIDEMLTAGLLTFWMSTIAVASVLIMVKNDSEMPVVCAPWCDTVDMLGNVDTGSIMLSRHIDARTDMMGLIGLAGTPQQWSHVGIILRKDSDLYLLDCMAGGSLTELQCLSGKPRGKNGPRIVRLDEYMLAYSLGPGVSAVRAVQNVSPSVKAAIWTHALECTRYSFAQPHELWVKFASASVERLLKFQWGPASNDWYHSVGVFCSEVSCLVLMRSGVLLDCISPSQFGPWTMSSAKQLDVHLRNNITYGPPVTLDVFKRIGVNVC
jgi:hypothetical protein